MRAIAKLHPQKPLFRGFSSGEPMVFSREMRQVWRHRCGTMLTSMQLADIETPHLPMERGAVDPETTGRLRDIAATG